MDLQLKLRQLFTRWLVPATDGRGARDRAAGPLGAVRCWNSPKLAGAWIALFLSLGAFPAESAPVSEKAAKELQSLAWMEGCWVGEEGGVRSEECWTAPGGGILLGMHRDVRPSGKSFFEFLRISIEGDGVTYWGSPMGRTPTPFPGKEIGEKRAVFENLSHDYPQRIIYWLEEDGSLSARVEGDVKGTLRQESWRWRPAVRTGPDGR